MPKIPSLPAITTLADADELPVEDVSASTTKKTTLTKLKEYFQSLTSWISPSMLNLAAQTADVLTAQTTTSAGIVDLATAGPSVTVNIGANGMCLIIANVSYKNSVVAEGANLFYTVSGATTVAGTSMMNTPRASRADTYVQTSAAALVTGLNPGNNTIKLQYGQNSGGTSTYNSRRIIVIPL